MLIGDNTSPSLLTKSRFLLLATAASVSQPVCHAEHVLHSAADKEAAQWCSSARHESSSQKAKPAEEELSFTATVPESRSLSVSVVHCLSVVILIILICRNSLKNHISHLVLQNFILYVMFLLFF